MDVALIYDPIFLEHETGGHPERKERLLTVMAALEKADLLASIGRLDAEAATMEQLTAVHEASYVRHLELFGRDGGGWLDADTAMSPGSFRAAVYAAGAGVKAVDAVLGGQAKRVFCLVRPPGHHAGPSRAAGFCLLNNIAIAARHAIDHHGLERVLIVDFDVHHGNGSQDIFYEDSKVLYFSTHQWPLYPGTGYYTDIGTGAGLGYTVNVPLPPLSADIHYLAAFDEVLVPVARRYRPQLVLVSAGYDAHLTDDIALQRVSTGGYARLVGVVNDLADEICDGRVAMLLEGGYSLSGLSESIRATFEVLLGQDVAYPPVEPSPEHDRSLAVDQVLRAVKEIHKLG